MGRWMITRPIWKAHVLICKYIYVISVFFLVNLVRYMNNYIFSFQKYSINFEKEHIGMIELPYMTEERMEKIGIPMGPRLRIIQEAQLCFRQENFNIYIV